MSSTHISVSDFFELYAGEQMVSGEDVGVVAGYTKDYIVLGLKNEAGVSPTIIPFERKARFLPVYESYCFVNPDESLLIENWVRKQRHDTRNLRIWLIAVTIVEILILLL